MTVQEIEYCCNCDEPTGNAGKDEDSLYIENDHGPFCSACFGYFELEEKLAEAISLLKRCYEKLEYHRGFVGPKDKLVGGESSGKLAYGVFAFVKANEKTKDNKPTS